MARSASRGKPQDGLSQEARDQVALKRVDNYAQAIRIGGLAVVGFFFCGFVLACYPLAKVFAGRNTVIDISVSISIAVALTLGGAALIGRIRWLRRRVKHLERENRQLAEDNHVYQDRLRQNKLPDTIERRYEGGN